MIDKLWSTCAKLGSSTLGNQIICHHLQVSIWACNLVGATGAPNKFSKIQRALPKMGDSSCSCYVSC
eukprot:8685918-Karenia_brevis.AAC.1